MRRSRHPLPGGQAWGRWADEDLRVQPPRKVGPLAVARRIVIGAALVVAAVALGGSMVLGVVLYRYAHPPRSQEAADPAALFLPFQDVQVPSSDGVPISAWWIRGGAGLPAVILGHDRGSSRSSLLGLASRLAEQRYSVLLIDFRGHGASGGNSSFGVLEARDLLGALDWVGAQEGVDGSRAGLYGVGMGAHAAVLAAADRRQVRSLALDSPYPDAPARFLAARIPPGFLHGVVASWSGFLYDILYRVRAADQSAARKIAELSERNLIILAPRADEAAVADAKSLYEAVSETRNNFKNLLLLPATRSTALYGQDRQRYDDEVVAFFRSYLPPEARSEVRPRSDPDSRPRR